jgi:hypothetical protein
MKRIHNHPTAWRQWRTSLDFGYLFIFVLLLMLFRPARAANMCDSVWLDYQDGLARNGNLIAIDARVEETQLYSYYASLVWNTGYMGLQRGGGGYYKHVHFSIWDSTNGTPVEVMWKANDVEAVRFGGEGTGYKVMFPFNWVENTTYRFCVTLEHVV